MNGLAVILNSRQKLHPLGNDEWIQNSEQAVKYASEHGLTLLTSVGMNTWETVLYLASKYKVMQRVYLQCPTDNSFSKTCEYLEKEFKLESELVKWHPLKTECSNQKGNDEFRKIRDRMIIADSDTAIPISIRRGGNLMQAIGRAESQGLCVDRNFECPYEESSASSKTEFSRIPVRNDIDRLLSDYVIHWTRTTHNPWPGEISSDYYKAVTESTDEYSHSAKRTLIRILNERELRASSRHMRTGVRAVSFSDLEPSRAVLLMKWRARYREMTFEPYGIAVKKETALNIGVRKVYYGNPEMYQYLDKKDQPYFQSIGIKGYWMPECEYRYIGDLDINSISPESMAVIIRDSNEKDLIRRYFEGQILSIY